MRAPAGFPLDTKIIGDTVYWARGTGGGFAETVYDRVGLDGSPRSSIVAQGVAGLDHHDLISDGTDGWYAIAYAPRENVDLTALSGPADATVLDAQIRCTYHSRRRRLALEEPGPHPAG